jgi:large subunit ribosomal protein L29
VVVEDLRSLGSAEIERHVTDLREQLFKLRFQKTTGQVANAAKLSSVRRDIARALTVLRQRELAGTTAGAGAGSEEMA